MPRSPRAWCKSTAHTDNAPIAAVRAAVLPHYGVQFHPEVVHTDHGRQILENFAHRICGAQGDWTPASFVEEKKQEIREQVGDEHVILGLSGGVDSSVAAVLLHQALGDQLTCIFVNNGLLRKGEWEQVQTTFRDHFHIRLHAINASDLRARRDGPHPGRRRRTGQPPRVRAGAPHRGRRRLSPRYLPESTRGVMAYSRFSAGRMGCACNWSSSASLTRIFRSASCRVS